MEQRPSDLRYLDPILASRLVTHHQLWGEDKQFPKAMLMLGIFAVDRKEVQITHLRRLISKEQYWLEGRITNTLTFLDFAVEQRKPTQTNCNYFMPRISNLCHGSSRLALFSRPHQATHTLRHSKGLHIQFIIPSVPLGGAIDDQNPEGFTRLEGNYGGTKDDFVFA